MQRAGKLKDLHGRQKISLINVLLLLLILLSTGSEVETELEASEESQFTSQVSSWTDVPRGSWRLVDKGFRGGSRWALCEEDRV